MQNGNHDLVGELCISYFMGVLDVWIFLVLVIKPRALLAHAEHTLLTLSDIPSPRGTLFLIYLNIFEIGMRETMMTGQVVMTLDMMIQACRMSAVGR